MDSGVMRRMRIGQFDSDFIDGLDKDDPINCRFKLDHGFGIRLRGELKDALLNLIFDYSKKFVDEITTKLNHILPNGLQKLKSVVFKTMHSKNGLKVILLLTQNAKPRSIN